MHKFIQGIKSFVAWEWISSVTKSLFKLASYIVELPMVASGVYIMIATGVPGWNNPDTFNLAMAVLLAAPEILAPGAFFRAETMQSRGKLRAAKVTRWLASAMLFFAALTFSSIMIFHFSEQVLQAVMFFRVMTSLGYSIITRVDMERGAIPAQPPALQTVDIQQLIAQAIGDLQTTFNQQLAELASQQQSVLTQLAERQPLDYDAVTQQVLTHLQAEFDARQKGMVEVRQEEMSAAIDAPKPRQKRISAPKNDASKKILTLRQPSASTTDKKTIIHALLAQDLSLTSYYLAGQAHCSEATARRIKNEYIDAHSDASDAGQNDALEPAVLTHDALRHDA